MTPEDYDKEVVESRKWLLEHRQGRIFVIWMLETLGWQKPVHLNCSAAAGNYNVGLRRGAEVLFNHLLEENPERIGKLLAERQEVETALIEEMERTRPDPSSFYLDPETDDDETLVDE